MLKNGNHEHFQSPLFPDVIYTSNPFEFFSLLLRISFFSLNIETLSIIIMAFFYIYFDRKNGCRKDFAFLLGLSQCFFLLSFKIETRFGTELVSVFSQFLSSTVNFIKYFLLLFIPSSTRFKFTFFHLFRP